MESLQFEKGGEKAKVNCMGVFFLGQVALVQSGSGKTPLPTQKRVSALDFELKFEFHPAKLEEQEAGVSEQRLADGEEPGK